MVKVVQGLEVQSQDAVSLHGRGEPEEVYQLPTASHLRQVRPAVLRTVCAATVLGSGVQTTLAAVVFAAAAAVAVEQTGCDLALVVQHLRVV